MADLVHQGPHEQKAPATRPQQVFRQQWIGDAGRVEAGALVRNADDEVFAVARQLNLDYPVRIPAIAVNDGVDHRLMRR